MVNSAQYAGKTIKIEDSCAHGTDRISLEIMDGAITQQHPETVFIQRGGG
ncbi:MAG: hypothetical protein IID14_05280 [Candidatus Marinimicrobia bacterium]|nr:hypothetical protein [Candidatus Neomarinimicrobiota bacterium]